jgi:hypothetical protein
MDEADQSDVQLHVAPLARWVIAFPTANARRLLEALPSTPEGCHLPWRHIDDIWRADWPEDCPGFQEFIHPPSTDLLVSKRVPPIRSAGTAERLARLVAQAAIRQGILKPAWVGLERGTEVLAHDAVIAESGLVLVPQFDLVIQVKCDFYAGGTASHRVLGCTGNIFLQPHELNPRNLEICRGAAGELYERAG